MKPKRATLLARRLFEIAQRLASSTSKPRQVGMLVALEGAGFILTEDATEQFNALLRELLEEGRFGGKFSEKFVEN